MIDLRHEMVALAALIDWELFEREWETAKTAACAAPEIAGLTPDL